MSEIEASKPPATVILCGGWGRFLMLTDLDELKAKGFDIVKEGA